MAWSIEGSPTHSWIGYLVQVSLLQSNAVVPLPNVEESLAVDLGSGLMTGTGESQVSPQMHTTRSQAAVLLYRLLKRDGVA